MTPEALAAAHARAMEAPWSAADFAALLAGPGVFVSGDADCFALGRAAADEAELLMLATAPDLRRRGLGRAALAAFEAEAAKRGARTVFLEVAEGNAAARALYSAAGWTVAARRPGYYRAAGGAREDAVLMRKVLAREADSA